MPFDLNRFGFTTISIKNTAGVASLRRHYRTQASRIALRATMGVMAVTGINMLSPTEAWASCVLNSNVVCDGPVPDVTASFTNFDSVTYQNGETNKSTTGVILIGGAVTPTISAAVDATSAITATTIKAPNNGNALSLTNDFGGISTTTPFGNGINGNLTSTVGAGLSATTNNAAGNITIGQGATSTIFGSTVGITATVKNDGVIDIKTLGTVAGDKGIFASSNGLGNVSVTASSVTATGGTAIDASLTSSAVSNGAVTVTTLGSGVISANGGHGIIAQNSLNGSGGITVSNDAAIKVSGGNGIFAINNGGTGDIKITSNGAIGSGVGGPGTLATGILAALNPGSQGNIVVNLGADIGAVGDVAVGTGIVATSGGGGNLGDIGITVTKASIFAATGITVQMFGKGDVSIVGTGTGTISGANGNGISAAVLNANAGNIIVNVTQDVIGKTGGITASTSGDGNISVTAGNVTTATGTGINATTTGLGSVSVAGSGNVASGTGTGIKATITNAANASDVIVNRTGGTVAGDKGIFASSNGLGNVSVTASSVTATGGTAIDASLTSSAVSNGAVTVTTLGSGVISANGGHGIIAQNSLNGSGGITVSNDAAIKVSGGNGIFAINNGGTGDIKITSNGAIGSGVGGPGTLATGILAALNPGSQGNIEVNLGADIGALGDVAVGTGIVATSGGGGNLGDIGITVTKASIFAATGITAQMFGKGDVSIVGTGTGTISGATGTGISATIFNARPGNILVDVTQDVVSKTGGIIASTSGDGNISVTAGGNLTATAGVGISATNTNVAANAGTVTVTQAASKTLTASGNGIETDSGISTGATSVNVNGTILASGDAGVKGTSTLGGITVNVAATGKIDPLIGIDLATVAGALAVNNAGVVDGDNIGVQLISTGAGVVGDLTVAQSGTGTINGTAAQGVLLRSADAAQLVLSNKSGTTISGGTLGIDAQTTGTGGITIFDNNIIGKTGGILAKATGVTSGIFVGGEGSVTTTGGTAVDLLINNAASTGGIGYNRIGNVIGEQGINAVIAAGTGNIILNVTGDVTATNGTAITAAQNDVAAATGAVSVQTAAGSTIVAAVGDNGIDARNDTAGTDVIQIFSNAALKVSSGVGIVAVRNNGSGDVVVISNGTIGSGSAGAGTLIGGIIAGTNAPSNGNVTVLVNASIGDSSDVATATGVTAVTNGTGYVLVEIDNADIWSTGSGINAQTSKGGSVTVLGSGTGTINSAGGTGISAINFGVGAGQVAVQVTQSVVGKTAGISATTSGGGNALVNAVGNVSATGGTGITATNNNAAANAGTIDVFVASGKTVTGTGGNGIETNSGLSTGTTTIGINGNVTSTDKSGVLATSNGGVTIVQAVASAITAGVDAIKVNSGIAGGAITISAGGTLVANNGSGVFVNSASATADPITVTTNIVKSTGGAGTWGSQVRTSAGTGDIVIYSNGAITSATGPGTIFGGILALTSGTSNRNVSVNVTADIGTATDLSSAAQVQVVGASTSAKMLAVNVNNANIFGGPGAIRVEQGAAGLGDVIVNGTGTGTLSATKAGAIGINARNLNAANAGKITIDVTQNVVGVAQGINASTIGSGNISATARGNVTATAGSGIAATNASAAANAGSILVQVASGKLVSATGGNGITTNSGLSTGATTIVVAGEVKASGAGFAGIKGISTAGNISVLVANTGKVDPEIGIDLATVNGALLVNNAGLVQGDVTAIKLAATGTGTGTVINSGTVTGGINAVLGSVVNTPFVITNGGTMTGAVNVTGSTVATSSFTSNGTWNSGASASNFAGNFANSGITNIGAGGAVTIQGTTNNSNFVNFAGAGTYTSNGAMTNTGVINAVNNITGNQVIVNAAYTGGGQFFADYNSGTVTADTLRITGAASGNTNVALNRLGQGFVPTGFLPIVTVVPGGAAGLFTLTTALPSVGFLLESFGQNPTNTSQWGIIQAVNPVFGDLGGVSTLAQTASAMLNEPASAFVTQKANPAAGETQIGLWMRGGAGNTKEDLTTTLSSGAFATSLNSRLRMSHQAMQLGLDYGLLNMGGNGWNLHFGVTGGKLDAGAKRPGSTTNIQFEATFAGGYIFLTDGALTLDASVRKEWREFKIASAGLITVSPQEAEGDATVASILASYRIGGATGFHITPQVGYSYGDSDIDPFAIDAFTQFAPGGDKTEFGQAGVKLGYRGESGNLVFEPFVSAMALRNWSNRENTAVVFTGTSTADFDVNTFAFRNAVRYSVGLRGSDSLGKISAFVVGNLTDGNRVDGASVSVGARINF